MRATLLLTLALCLAACASTANPPEDTLPPPADRQSQLTQLYDRLRLPEPAGSQAADACAGSDARDRRFLASLWGNRPATPEGARRLGNAMAAQGHQADALAWLERAYSVSENHDEMAWLRYEMALCYMELGRPDDAVNVLSIRLGSTPMPADLQPLVDALLERASR